MSIYKRKNSSIWYIQYTDRSGKRIQVSSDTTDRQQAQELHDKLKAESWRQERLGEKPKYKWQDACVAWVQESQHKKSLNDDIAHLNWLDPYLRGAVLQDIDRAKIEELKKAKLATGVKAGTVNRMLALIRAILRRAEREWEWIDRAPHVKLLAEPKKRIRWLTKEEAQRLLLELPPHLSEMARFALATGLRDSNITGLKWADVDMKRACAWVHHDEAKGKKAFAVPLNDDALACVRRQQGKSDEYVFTYKGNPVTRCNNHAWVKALERAGIEDFRFHDLRHTWASWHVMNGTPLHVLQELGGWSDMAMVLRYAHLSPGHLKEYARNLEIDEKLRVVR